MPVAILWTEIISEYVSKDRGDDHHGIHSIVIVLKFMDLAVFALSKFLQHSSYHHIPTDLAIPSDSSMAI